MVKRLLSVLLYVTVSRDQALNHQREQTTPRLKNVPPLICYNFDTREWILIFFLRDVANKLGDKRRLTVPP